MYSDPMRPSAAHSVSVVAAALVLLLCLGTAGPSFAQATGAIVPRLPASNEPPYEARLLRMAEILGSVHYLRHLCNDGDETDWRGSMQALIDSETAGEPARRERFTAGFNRGYRAFAAVYSACTPAAIAVEAQYRSEGATLAAEIIARYGN